jgi:hypothetical protein
MDAPIKPKRSWVDLLALTLAFFGALVSFFGALLTYVSQVKIEVTSLWPLPGLVLIDWVLVGSIGFVVAFFSIRKSSAWWLRTAWLLTGAFIPLIILGAFSIGLMVVVAFLLFVVSTIILAIRHQTKWLESFGFLMLGSIGNLGLLMLIITLGTQSTL